MAPVPLVVDEYHPADAETAEYVQGDKASVMRMYTIEICHVLDGLNLHRRSAPYLSRVFLNRPVRRELAYVPNVQDGHFRPQTLVFICLGNPFLAFYIRFIICKTHILLAME